jgi:hypothetical protein
MPKALVTDELWKVVEPLLPEEPPKPNGGAGPACLIRRRSQAYCSCSRATSLGGDALPRDVHTAANIHDSKALEEAVDAISPIRKRRGRPRKRPKKPRLLRPRARSRELLGFVHKFWSPYHLTLARLAPSRRGLQ